MIPLIYVLQNGVLDDSQQMALALLDGLRDEFKPYVFAPPGNVINEAQKMGFVAQTFSSATDLTMKLWLLVSSNDELGFVATELAHSYSMILLNAFYRRRLIHLHVIKGGEDEYSGYTKRASLKKYDVIFITHSEFIKEKLIAHGTGQERVRVIENFLSEKRKGVLRQRVPFETNGVKKVMVVSSFESEAKVDLLLDALDFMPDLSELKFTFYGSVSQSEALKKRVSENNLNVEFAGSEVNIAEKFAETDLFLDLCPTVSSGLTMLEAMAANVPVLISDGGTTGSTISHNINGFSFPANDAEQLAYRLNDLSKASFDFLNAIAKGGKYLLNIRFSAENSVERYRRLFTEQKLPVVDLTGGKLIL
jgi:glycosyltransferase involved in cell wall biosynthesis